MVVRTLKVRGLIPTMPPVLDSYLTRVDIVFNLR
jgi:hypothetical protein